MAQSATNKALKKSVNKFGLGLGFVSIFLMLGACSSNNSKLEIPYGMKKVEKTSASINDFRDTPPAANAQSVEWWQNFADDTLKKLVEDAKDENISLLIAQARLKEARAQGRSTIAGFAPRIDASANYSGNEANKGGSLFDANGNPVDKTESSSIIYAASWEIPLFGRFGSSLNGAKANESAAKLGIEAAKIALISDISAAYIELRAAQTQLRYLKEDSARADNLAAISKDRLRVGLVSVVDEAFARSAAEGIKAQIPDAILRVNGALDRLAILRGVSPGELDSLLALNEGQNFEFKYNAPSVNSVPADFVRRRIDVRTAEQQAILQSAAVGIARADLYPRVSIQGAISAISAISGNPVLSTVGRTTTGASVSLPLFDFGQRNAAVRSASARFTQAMLNYKATTLAAIAEGQSALTGYNQGRERAIAATNSEVAAKTRLDASNTSFKAGIISFKDLIEAERDYSNARQTRLLAQSRFSDSAIGLYRSFAGSPEIVK